MKQNRFYITYVFCIISTLTWVGLNYKISYGQSRPDAQQHRIDINSIQDSFVSTLIIAKKPGGIILAKQDCAIDQGSEQLKVKTRVLHEALDFIVQASPQYRWNIEQDVVNFFPVDDEPEFLKIQIKEFNIDGSLHINLLLDQLLSLPEVKGKAVAQNLNQGLEFGGLTSMKRNQIQYTVYLKDVTLRQVLNEIVRIHGRAVWRYSETSCNGKSKTNIDFIVQ